MWPFRRRHKPPPNKIDVLASHVRPKGITRPLRSVNAPGSIQRTPIEVVLQSFLRTSTWSETRSMLDREREVLLSDDAITLLDRFIHDVQQSGMSDATEVARYLAAHRALLLRARQVGVELAWDDFLAAIPSADKETPPEDDETESIMAAVKELLGTDTWRQTREVFAREQRYLLTDAAEHLIESLIQLATQEGTPEAMEGARYLELHLHLLREARTLGPDRAWQRFDAARQSLDRAREQHTGEDTAGLPPDVAAVARALRAFLTTQNWDETRQLLDRDRDLLLTDICERMIVELINEARGDSDPQAPQGQAYLDLHLRLLRMARREGIDVAWERFRRDVARTQRRPNLAADATQAAEATGPVMSADDISVAVHAYLRAANWVEVGEILDKQRAALLTEVAVRLIEVEANRAPFQDDERDAAIMQRMRLQAQLLRRAREVGVERAWSEFEAER